VTQIIRRSAETAAIKRRRSASRRRRVSAITVMGLAVAAGASAAAAGCRPMGTRIADPVYTAVFAALVTYVCSRASRETLLVFSAVAVVMSRRWLEIPAAAALLIAFSSVLPRHSRRRVGALVGALAVETLLRWPPLGFDGFTAVVAGVVLVPVLFSAFRRASTAERRRAKRGMAVIGAIAVVLSVPLVVAAAMARGAISTGQHAADLALSDVSNGDSASATSKLRVATAAFADASSTLGSWWTSVADVVPAVAQQRRALATGATTARDLLAVAAHVAPNLDYHDLSYHKGQVDLSHITAMFGPALRLDRSLSEATARLSQVRNPWLISTIQSRLRTFDQSLSRALSSTDLAVKAIPLVPAMLGSQQPQHYFLAFVTPAESRGLDGIVGAYGELTAANGHVSLTVSGPVSGPAPSLNSALPSAGGILTGLPGFMARYGQYDPGKYFQDVTFSPDFPTVAQVISQLYPQAGGAHLDGVLMVDPYALARLLSITGPISVPGLSEPLTSHNAAAILLKGQYLTGSATSVAAVQSARHDLLQDVLHLTFQRVVDGSLPSPKVLSHDLEPAVLSGRIAFWSAHSNDAPLVHALHLGDAFPQAAGGDLLAVTEQNSGANKIDAYLHVSTTDHIVVDPGTGSVNASVRITLRNDAPASGLPPIVIDSPDAPGTPVGANYCLLSIYTPYPFERVTLNGKPTTVSVGTELGMNVYSQWVLVAPKSTATLALSLKGLTTPGSPYVLHLRLQPAANTNRFQATFAISTTGTSQETWTAGPNVDQVHVFRAPGVG
jgi:hypothetical protein